MYDSKVLGGVVDQPTEEEQTELNWQLLYSFDQEKLLQCIKNRVSKYFLNDYLDDLKYSPKEYWRNIVLREIISHYALPLKLFLSEGFEIDIDIKMEIFKLIRYLKIDLLDKVYEQFKKQEKVLNEEFLKFIKTIDELSPFLFRWSMTYIDRESLERFVKIILEESKQPYFFDGV